MNNFGFLKDYLELQQNIMFNRLTELDFALVGYCKGDKSIFWNHALTNQILSKEQLEKIEKTMKSYQRDPTVYFENKNSLSPLIKLLKENKYVKGFEDSWLFHSGENIGEERFNQVKKVKTPIELKTYLKVFDNCYQKNDPQNAYGELGEYLKVAERVWHEHNKTDRLEYFIVYQKNIPVAVATLTNFNKIGYISNVGSLKKVRGQGFGKLATLYCVWSSKRKGNKQHCLATEEGTYA